MRAVFAFFVYGKHVFIILFVGGIPEHHPPRRIDNLFPGCFKFFLADLGQDSCVGNFAVRIKHGDEAFRHQVIHPFFIRSHIIREHAGRNNGMVVCDLFVVENFCGFPDFCPCQNRCGQCFIRFKPFENTRHFSILVVGQEIGIYARIGG